MTHTQESRPGRESKAAVYLAKNSLPASLDQTIAAALVTGVHVVIVETPAGKYRRRVYLSLDSAQKAADRAIMAGHQSSLILCKLMPVMGGELL